MQYEKFENCQLMYVMFSNVGGLSVHHMTTVSGKLCRMCVALLRNMGKIRICVFHL